MFRHASRLVVSLVVVFCAAWCVDGHASYVWHYYPSALEADVAYSVFQGTLTDSVTNLTPSGVDTFDGHSCDFRYVAHGRSPVFFGEYFNYCSDGYMGSYSSSPSSGTFDLDVWMMLLVVGMAILFGLGFVGGQQR